MAIATAQVAHIRSATKAVPLLKVHALHLIFICHANEY